MEKFPQRLGMHRSGHATYTTYWGDGAGRDSYAIIGNGGLCKPESYVYEAPRTGYNPRTRTGPTMYAGPMKPYRGAGKEATVFRYYGDGQGRDSYMCRDSGGLIPHYESTSPDKVFFSQLRSDKKNTTVETDSAGQKVKDWSQHTFKEQIR